MLDERKERCITYILEGLTYTAIADLISCSRQSIYEWLKNDDFAAELNRRRQEIVVSGNNMILNKLSKYVDGVDAIALDSESDKSRFDALTYMIDRVLGRTTTKVETTTPVDKENVGTDALNALMDKSDNK